jgi:hypothetical protein
VTASVTVSFEIALRASFVEARLTRFDASQFLSARA